MIFSHFNNNIIDSGNEGGTSCVLLDTPPPHFHAFVLMNCEPMLSQVQTPFAAVRETKVC